MRIFRKQTVRAPWTTVLLVLLLALSIAAASVGFAAWVGGQKQFASINDQYSTIAILSGMNTEKLWEVGNFYPAGVDSFRFEDGSLYIGPKDALAEAERSQYFLGSSDSILLNAEVEGCTGLTSGTMDIMDYSNELDAFCYQLSVLAVRCISIEANPPIDLFDWISYTTEFEIIDPVCRMDSYDLPPKNGTIILTSGLYTADGSYPFEVGKTYLVRGRYWDYPICETHQEWVEQEDGTKQLRWVRVRDVEYSHRSYQMEGYSPMVEVVVGRPGVTPGLIHYATERIQYPNSGLCYWKTPEGCWPYYAEYEGEWRDYLASEDGRVWREEIIPDCERNHASVGVILTDNIDHLYAFNTGAASILEGRRISLEEYESGANVCLVSAAYAKLNSLAVGDSIRLDYYDTGCVETEYGLGTHNGKLGMTIQRAPLSDETHLNIQEEYQIVGIYTAPEWQPGLHSFHADTIFVPRQSVPNVERRTENSPTMLNSIVIENGSIDAFEAHMAANDKAGAYLYFDQGYTEAAATVQTLIDNAMRLMMVGIAMFLLASMLFLLLFARRVSAVMRSMRLLGVPKKGVWLESLGMLVMQESIAVLLGNGLAVILYDRITAQFLSGTPALDITSIALCAGVQLAVLVVAGGIWMHRIAGSNLMQKSEGGKLLWNKNRAASCGA